MFPLKHAVLNFLLFSTTLAAWTFKPDLENDAFQEIVTFQIPADIKSQVDPPDWLNSWEDLEFLHLGPVPRIDYLAQFDNVLVRAMILTYICNQNLLVEYEKARNIKSTMPYDKVLELWVCGTITDYNLVERRRKKKKKPWFKKSSWSHSFDTNTLGEGIGETEGDERGNDHDDSFAGTQ